ncbi:hypothetical protein Y032_0013g2138 [Ancylostoma ceylanicum]|uniref:Uncharacterized protein n=1 Tax=Ancylostoma ceylanicum TaxID=53326 RepID=A0A016VB06_9BILA|nr:hypothetical protein Y032_0013g2138 [Ancylostoma ceylanicum]
MATFPVAQFLLNLLDLRYVQVPFMVRKFSMLSAVFFSTFQCLVFSAPITISNRRSLVVHRVSHRSAQLLHPFLLFYIFLLHVPVSSPSLW